MANNRQMQETAEVLSIQYQRIEALKSLMRQLPPLISQLAYETTNIKGTVDGQFSMRAWEEACARSEVVQKKIDRLFADMEGI